MSYRVENKHDRELTASMHSIGSVVDGVFHEADARSRGEDPLRGHPGLSADVLAAGRSRLNIAAVGDQPRGEREAFVWGAVQVEFERGSKLCESPIEREMLAALLTADWSFAGVEFPRVHSGKNYDEPLPIHNAVIIPQMALVRYRVDLGMVVKFEGRPRLFGVECDGADFHNREDDNRRDDYLARLGVGIIRVSGQQIHRSPLGVANDIVAGLSQLSLVR